MGTQSRQHFDKWKMRLEGKNGFGAEVSPSSWLCQGECWHFWAEVAVLFRPGVACSRPFGPPLGWGHWASSLQPTSLGAFPEQEDEAPPRPPLPELYSPEDQPPAVPPLPREATVIRHTSVRGLKRQSDERKRDREQGQCVNGDSRVSRQDRGLPSVGGEREGGGMLGSVTALDSAHRWSSGRT